MMNCFTEVCVESANVQFNFLILKPQELSKPAPKPRPPRGFALRLKRPGGSIEIRGAGGERATGTCLCVARAALFFACVRPPPPKNRKTGRSKKNRDLIEKTFYIALPSSAASILKTNLRADRQEHKDIRGGTQGAAKRVGFARSGSVGIAVYLLLGLGTEVRAFWPYNTPTLPPNPPPSARPPSPPPPCPYDQNPPRCPVWHLEGSSRTSPKTSSARE
jgi:hypothetical protein